MLTPDALLPRVRERLPGVQATDDLLLELIQGCMDSAAAYTWREELPDAMGTLLVLWAVVQYNQLGIEGETSHSEGGVGRGMQIMPDNIKGELTQWRLGRVGFT